MLLARAALEDATRTGVLIYPPVRDGLLKLTAWEWLTNYLEGATYRTTFVEGPSVLVLARGEVAYLVASPGRNRVFTPEYRDVARSLAVPIGAPRNVEPLSSLERFSRYDGVGEPYLHFRCPSGDAVATALVLRDAALDFTSIDPEAVVYCNGGEVSGDPF